MSLKAKREQKNLAVLNDIFHSGEMTECDDLYRILRESGIDYRQCILIHTIADGGRAYVGNIIVPDGWVMGFDLDPDCPEYNEWTDETAIWYAKYQYYQYRKPWLKAVVAYELFYAMQQLSHISLHFWETPLNCLCCPI